MNGRVHAIIAMVVTGVASRGTAQVLQPVAERPARGLTLDVLKPALDKDAWGEDFTTLTTISHVGFRWSFGNTALTADLPYVNVGVSGGGSSTQLGNLGIGVATTAAAGFQGGLELLIPTASGGGDDNGDLAQFVGLVADYQSFESYLNDLTTLRGTLGYGWAQSSGPAVRVAVRPAVVKPKEGDTELLADVGVAAEFGQNWWTAGAGLTGRYWITEEEANLPFGKLVTELDLGFRGTFGAFVPGVYLRVPLDSDLKEGLGPSLGIRLGYAFGK